MEKTKLRPLGDRVLIEPSPIEEKTAGGIFISETANEKPLEGKVIATGLDNEKAMTVKEGDTVIYGKRVGTTITVEGKEYLLMREQEIYGIKS